MLSRCCAALALAVAAALVGAAASAAVAGGGDGYTVGCQPNSTSPVCAVSVTAPGSSRGAAPMKAPPAGSAASSCSSGGKPRPCSLPGYGWLGANGCYYKLDTTWKPPPGDTADRPPAGEAGAFYDVSCFGVAGTGEAITWLKAGTAPGPPPAPAVLAQEATGRLTLQVGGLQSSPPAGGEQLVNLPTWVWLTRWAAVSAAAAVPGESVTATARPVSATWSFGDGSSVVCRGPGTAYQPSDGAATGSPTCGHTYRSSSAGRPGGAFPVTVTVRWAITWTGGGRAGTEPALTATARAQFRVAESQAINTSTGSGS
jgi:hypothetical protein